jgi:hypothetical protein
MRVLLARLGADDESVEQHPPPSNTPERAIAAQSPRYSSAHDGHLLLTRDLHRMNSPDCTS